MDERCKFVIKMIKRSFSSILFLDFDEKSDEGTYASVKSLLSRNYMHHVDLSETRKSPKG
jgi:hypothetical protein